MAMSYSVKVFTFSQTHFDTLHLIILVVYHRFHYIKMQLVYNNV